MSPSQLRHAIRDGSIADEVDWKPVAAGDVIHIPAGTIHAIGAGVVLAEIQQRSDATYRLFDHGRDRELHGEDAIAATHAASAGFQVRPDRISGERTLLVSNRHFTFERLDLPPASSWLLMAKRECWLLVLSGGCATGWSERMTGEALFAEDASFELTIGPLGLQLLLAYPGEDGPQADLLTRTA